MCQKVVRMLRPLPGHSQVRSLSLKWAEEGRKEPTQRTEGAAVKLKGKMHREV